MGGQSTSESAVLNSGGQKDRSFDLRSWQGLTHVLKAGKDSLKDPQAYAEFRNLVLEYAQKGGDESLRKQIDAIVATFSTVSEKPVPQPRPFVPPLSKEQVTTPVPEIVPEPVSEPAPEPEATPEEDPQPIPEPEPVPEPKKIDAIARRPEPVFIPRSERNKVETVSDDPSEEEVVPEPVEEEKEEVSAPEPLITIGDIATHTPQAETAPRSAPEPEPVHTPAPSPASERVAVHKTMEEHKARIAQIKRLVHEKVGNPAALMGAYNEAGKKYMVALLTALKATGAGSPVGIDTAMADLEAAYEALVTGAPASAPEVKKVEIMPPPKVPEKKAEVEQPRPVPAHTPSAIIEALAADHKERELKAATRREPVSVAQPKPAVPPMEKKVEVRTPPVPPRASVPEPVVPSPRPSIEPVTPRISVTEAKVVPAPSPAPRVEAVQKPGSAPVKMAPAVQRSVPEPSYVPVAKMPEIKKPEIGARQQESTVPVYQSELFTPEVSRGVDSLLHEWPLFGGSGLFGMGPGGFEHPLYQKLANLSMGEVLAGRWEKADAKAIRTIKEYVDAWRHEQGIAYTINETFEHYLRRVVQRILKRQNS